MRTFALLLLLVASQARAQFVPFFAGQTPNGGGVLSSGGGGGGGADLPMSFSWYGDSIIVGFCNDTAPADALLALLPGYAGTARWAQAGTTISDITAQYFTTKSFACGGEPCGTYIFEGGVNDCKNGSCTPATMLSTFLTAIDDARADGKRVVWSNIAPFATCSFCTPDPAGGWVLAKQYNALWASACAVRPDVTCIDAGAGTAWEEPSTDGHLKTAWSCDGIHWLQ
jgi:hypothetical protein